MPFYSERLTEALTTAGVPVHGAGGTGPSDGIVWYRAEATDPQRQAGAAILAAFDWSQAAQEAWRAGKNRAEGAAAFMASTALGQIFRAEALVLVDEINALRDWITAFKAAVAAATTLADLKTRVAALAAMPDRTAAQAKSAIAAKAQDTASDA